MRIEITTTFDDLTKPEGEQRTDAGTKMTVTAERGAELVGLGLAHPLDAAASDTTNKED